MDSVLWAAKSENTKALLENCHASITEIRDRIYNLKSQAPNLKAAAPTIMSMGEIRQYREALVSQKVSLNTVISMTCLYAPLHPKTRETWQTSE